MKHSFVNSHPTPFLFAGLAAAVLMAGAVSSAQPVYPATPGDVEILVNGMPQRRYAHDGRWYVAALKGREYAIRIRNPYPVRAAVALSVDGLNTIDARRTTPTAARKWVLDPYQTITISGWQVNRNEARRFEFTTEEKSYGQALGQTANLGTISAVFFKERTLSFIDRAAPSVDSPSARVERQPASPAGESAGATGARKQSSDEYAATGMGERTGHAVTQVYLDLESVSAQTVNIRYEFREQLVRLGILREANTIDTLRRRERARGFEAGFAPEVR